MIFIDPIFDSIYFVDSLIILFIFRQISGVNLSRRNVFWIAFIFLAINILTYPFNIIIEPFYLLFLNSFFKNSWTRSQGFFYSLFPFVISDMFPRIIGLYLRFLFDINISQFNKSAFFNIILVLLLIPFYFYFFKGLGIDLSYLRAGARDKNMISLFNTLNLFLVTYLILVRGTIALEFAIEGGIINLGWDTYFLRTNIVVISFIVFVCVLLFLNYRVKEKQNIELQSIKDRQLADMSMYSQHVESLYREIRSFRHDYTNILVSLNESIKAEDIKQIRQVYDSVIADSDKKFYKDTYDIARLSNIQNDAMKSVLSSKLIEAQNKSIAISVEVEKPIDAPNIELIDFITILSIFLDNAIEAAEKVDQGDITIAYFEEDNRKVLIIDNAISEEKADLKAIFDYGHSSKGNDRGIGLSNVRMILDKYPNLSLLTNSKNYRFTQELVFFL